MSSTEGIVLLVGHSYGGVVITEAGLDPRVAGLIYVAAFAPDAGESLSSLRRAGGPAPLGDQIRLDAGGLLKLTREGFSDVLGQDMSDDDKAIAYAVQRPTSKSCLEGTITTPAWKAKPCVFLITMADRSFAPDLQKAMAVDMGADIVEVHSSHLVTLAHPAIVGSTIIKAAATMSE